MVDCHRASHIYIHMGFLSLHKLPKKLHHDLSEALVVMLIKLATF